MALTPRTVKLDIEPTDKLSELFAETHRLMASIQESLNLLIEHVDTMTERTETE